jgi:hypothetical protein
VAFGKVKALREYNQQKDGSFKLVEAWDFDPNGRPIKKTYFSTYKGTTKEEITQYDYSGDRVERITEDDKNQSFRYDDAGCLLEHRFVHKKYSEHSFTKKFKCEPYKGGLKRTPLEDSKLYDIYDERGRHILSRKMHVMFCALGRPCPDQFAEHTYKYGLSSDGTNLMFDEFSNGELQAREFLDKKSNEIVEAWGSMGRGEMSKKIYEYPERDAQGNWTTMKRGYLRGNGVEWRDSLKRELDYYD